MADRKAIVIGGGVGPMAGVALHAAIIENTLTDGSDQDHLEVLHFSRSAALPDRTAYLLDRAKPNPARGMAETFACARAALDRSGAAGVGGVPCNTFHARDIFLPFLRLLEEEGVGIPVVDMLDQTVELVRLIAPSIRRIGVMSTSGSRAIGLFRALFEELGIEVLEVPVARQDELQAAIYDRAWGIKAASPPSRRAVLSLRDLAGSLARRGAEAIVLGCTELPLALREPRVDGIPLVDPALALARGLVREASPGQLKPLEDVLRPRSAG